MMNITIDINGQIIEVLHVLRIEPKRVLRSTKKRDLDTLCQYSISNKDGHWLWHTPVTHRYGDGAAKLAAKILRRFGRKALS